MSDDPFLQSLIEAGRSELPEAARLEAIAAKVGAIGAAGAGGAGGAAAAAKAAGGIAGGAIAKGLGVVAVLAVATGTWLATREPPAPPSPTRVAIPSAITPIVPSVLPSVPLAPPVPAPSVSASVRSPAAHPPSPIEDPEEETRLLHSAQDVLAASPARALALSQEHARRFPGGLLAQEREVLAIDALLRLGRRAEATRRAESFARAFPGSTHRRRIDALLAAP